ncbi:hypothetical protein [Gallaecimonas sp. GXIMD4217]|uniref:hypothetical protein n=1 Tax=Gallaecimonas sp. GXIMD4217 TaxID=3131927 RepID=UPI00311AF915
MPGPWQRRLILAALLLPASYGLGLSLGEHYPTLALQGHWQGKVLFPAEGKELTIDYRLHGQGKELRLGTTYLWPNGEVMGQQQQTLALSARGDRPGRNRFHPLEPEPNRALFRTDTQLRLPYLWRLDERRLFTVQPHSQGYIGLVLERQ